VDTFRNASRDELIKLLAVCTRNAAINIYRKNKRKQDRESGIPLDREYEEQLLPINRLLYHQQDPAEIVVGKENKRELVQMIAEMDDVYKDVLLLRYQYKMSNRKIADILKISENAVGVRLHRAKKILLKEREAELNEIRKNGSV
jgi:RNA polymerase sigma-70 factor (ECF subfamily)